MQLFGQGYLVVQLAVRDGVPNLAPLYIGLVGLARAIPGLAFGLFGGVVADRSDRRRLLLVTQSLAAATSAVFAVLTFTGRIDIVQVLLIGALNSLIFSFDAPTRQSMVPRMVPERALMSAIGLNSAAFNGPQIVGPVIGGLLATAISGSSIADLRGIGVLFAVNAASYLATVGALLVMSPIPSEGRRDTPVLRSIREGLHHIRREPVVRWATLLSALTAIFGRPYVQLLPAVAHDTYGVGALELSWMLAAAGVGALAGALGTASLGAVRRRGLVLLISVLALGLALVVYGIERSFEFGLVLLVVMGVATMLALGLTNTLLQTRTPDHLRGRVMSVYTMIQIGLIPLGTMVLGSLGSIAGVSTSLFVGGAVITIAAVYALFRVPAIRGVTSQPRHRRRHAQVHPARPVHAEARSGDAAD